MSTIVAVVGATGFIGSECLRSLAPDYEVRAIKAPRLEAQSRSRSGLAHEVEGGKWRSFGERHFRGVDVVVNAAGLATATSNGLEHLLGANTLLPLFLAKSAVAAGTGRFVHLSSAAVQGRGLLDESERLAPENPYALSKALGELLIRGVADIDVIRYRPTSVHGAERAVTRSLLRLAQSPACVVAAPGQDPSPQIPVTSVGRAIALLVNTSLRPSQIVMHPWEGQTTSSFLSALGGRTPRELSRRASEALVSAAFSACPPRGGLRAHARRVEMLLFGQDQGTSWLDGRLDPPAGGWVGECREAILAADESKREGAP